MRILQIHNCYQQAGGEDVVAVAERTLLETHGHTVAVLQADNTSIRGPLDQLRAAGRAVYSQSARRAVAERIAEFQPDVMHVHNFFPLLSPAVHAAARAAGVPTVQTLHNYRLICPNALCFRDGHPCEDCIGKPAPWPGVLHACYRGSRPASAVVATMLTAHRLLGTWANKVNVYIALTEFARQRFIAGGLPAEKIVVKPNFVYSEPGLGTGAGGYALFVGRLSEEKGVATLLAAWKNTAQEIPLRIAGEGPMNDEVQVACQHDPRIQALGYRSWAEVGDFLKAAKLLIFPSLCYETFGKTIIEAFSAGTPVVASNLGAMATLVQHKRTGLLFASGDPVALARQVEWAWSHPAELVAMRQAARAEFEAKYTADRNYELLMAIYQQARGHR